MWSGPTTWATRASSGPRVTGRGSPSAPAPTRSPARVPAPRGRHGTTWTAHPGLCDRHVADAATAPVPARGPGGLRRPAAPVPGTERAPSRAPGTAARREALLLRLLAPHSGVATAPLDQVGIIDSLVRLRQAGTAQKLQNIEQVMSRTHLLTANRHVPATIRSRRMHNHWCALSHCPIVTLATTCRNRGRHPQQAGRLRHLGVQNRPEPMNPPVPGTASPAPGGSRPRGPRAVPLRARRRLRGLPGPGRDRRVSRHAAHRRPTLSDAPAGERPAARSARRSPPVTAPPAVAGGRTGGSGRCASAVRALSGGRTVE